ncbi:RWD domain-containing protein 4 [Anticarsia gemmatalis]|uniref:RWD domain-containing protein 4 n=1 Tax=Anticarsia gemmatalis TaxID=129554 RepID=UPI003F773804
MSDDAEQQAEEIEVLKSIYEGDDNFKQLDAKTYQYKYTDEDKSFILEISWGPTYPTEKPNFNLDIFYNQSLLPVVKEKILSIVDSEAEQWLGCAMTYTLFECLKEKVSEILAEQTEEVVVSNRIEKIVIDDQYETSKKPEKKEQLTKAQKRRAWDKAEIGRAGEKPRGYDWVDIVKHLSQAPHQPAS